MAGMVLAGEVGRAAASASAFAAAGGAAELAVGGHGSESAVGVVQREEQPG